MASDDELAYVENEREHFAQVARDTFQELKAVTAERDAYAERLRDASARRERIEALADMWSAPKSHRSGAWLRERDAADRIRRALEGE